MTLQNGVITQNNEVMDPFLEGPGDSRWLSTCPPSSLCCFNRIDPSPLSGLGEGAQAVGHVRELDVQKLGEVSREPAQSTSHQCKCV